MSHFSTVKTQIRKREPLLKALNELGYLIQEGQFQVRGYRGQSVKTELAVTTPKGGEIGFRWNSSTECYELVSDLDLWKEPVPIERFLAQLTQGYALNTVLSATAKEGFQLDHQTRKLDGSIELVVTRWDS